MHRGVLHVSSTRTSACPCRFRPPAPRSFLANYIQSQLPAPGAEDSYKAGVYGAARDAGLVPIKPFADMSREEKAKVVFAQLDRHRSG